MSDLIERQAAIDEMTNLLWHYPTECYRNLGSYEFAKSIAELGLKSVPSAQPDVTDINVGDMISREELFEELNCINLPVGNETVDKIFMVIENMPSAQPNKSDLIERQKAIDELISEPPEMNYGFYYAEKIKTIPSA